MIEFRLAEKKVEVAANSKSMHVMVIATPDLTEIVGRNPDRSPLTAQPEPLCRRTPAGPAACAKDPGYQQRTKSRKLLVTPARKFVRAGDIIPSREKPFI